MLFINDKKIEQPPDEVAGLTAKQQKTALVFIRGAVYACCTVDEESEYCEAFYVSELFGEDIANWAGTPLQCIYDACKKAGEGNNKDAGKLAFQAFEQLLKTCLINDERRFDCFEDGDEYDALYYWSEKCEVRERISDFMTADKKEKLRLIMSVLLDSVKNRATLGYKDVQDSVKKMNPALAAEMPYRRGGMAILLGDLNRYIQSKNKKARTITAIVVNQLTKLPGAGIDSFPGFEDYAKALDKGDTKKQREITKKEQAKVYDYGYSEWKKIYTKLFG